MDSHFPLSHIRRYTGVPERSLHFGRDDDTGIALSKHIRCTLREINPFSPHRHFERSEKSSLHSALSCSFRKRVPLFRYHTYGAIPVCKKDPSASLGMTLRKRRFLNISFIRDVGYPFPHTVISSTARNIPRTPLFLASFRRCILVFCYHTYDIIPSCKKDPSTSLGMTLRKWCFPNIPFIRDVGYPSPIPYP